MIPKGPTPRSRFRARSKYGAVPTYVNSVKLASKAEARRYAELLLLEKAGQIDGLEVHPVFKLHAPIQSKDLMVQLAVVGKFSPDFSYWRRGPHGMEQHIEDVKGAATLPLAKWKIRHFTAEYGLHVQEIRSR